VFQFGINGSDRRLRLWLKIGKGKPIVIESDEPLPTDRWVHLACVYNGQEVALYVNGARQSQKAAASGNLSFKGSPPMQLGGEGFQSIMEEMRLSNTARSNFPDYSRVPVSAASTQGTGIAASTQGTSIIVNIPVRQMFYYSGWRLVEEAERVQNLDGTWTAALVSRQFVDGGLGIDEHLTQDVYDSTGTQIVKSLYYHENRRGDTVALTDETGQPVLQLTCSPYGQISRINATGALEQFSDADAALVVYAFHGRQIDTETGFYYFRQRYYEPRQGRFITRDPMGYVDGMGLKEAFGGNPENATDPWGNQVWSKDLPDALKTDKNTQIIEFAGGKSNFTTQAEIMKNLEEKATDQASHNVSAWLEYKDDCEKHRKGKLEISSTVISTKRSRAVSLFTLPFIPGYLTEDQERNFFGVPPALPILVYHARALAFRADVIVKEEAVCKCGGSIVFSYPPVYGRGYAENTMVNIIKIEAYNEAKGKQFANIPRLSDTLRENIFDIFIRTGLRMMGFATVENKGEIQQIFVIPGTPTGNPEKVWQIESNYD
jgi:RHS repeat-associated protein